MNRAKVVNKKRRRIVATAVVGVLVVAGIVGLVGASLDKIELKSDVAMLEFANARQSRVIASLNKEIVDLELEIDRLKLKNKDKRTVSAIVTAYAPTDPDSVDGFDYEGDPTVTATGTKVREGICAADFRRLPPGTVLNVPGHVIVVVEDTGSAMRKAEGIHIDLCMESRADALEWGRQELAIEILYMPEVDG